MLDVIPDGGVRQDAPNRPRPRDEVDVMEYVLVLWRWRWAILAFVVVCGVAALVVGLMASPVYEASVKLIVAAPKTALAGEATPAVSVATFRALVENQSLADRLVREFKLNEPPLLMAATGFIRNQLDVETVRDTNVVIIRVRMPSPELATKVANRLADLAIDLSQRLSQDETVRLRDYIKTQVDQSRTRLDAAEARLTTFKKEAQVEALRKDVDAQLGQRLTLLPLLVQIQTEKAKLAQAEAQLAKRNRVGSIKKTIDADPTLMEAARQTARPGTGVLGLEVRNEYLDKVYEDLDGQVALIKTTLSGLEKQKAELVDVRKLGASQLALLNQLYSRENELARLQTEHELARTVYIDVTTRYEQVRLQVAGRSPQLQVLDSALPPDRPIGPKVVRNTVMGAIAALVVAAVLALFVDALAAAASRPKRAA